MKTSLLLIPLITLTSAVADASVTTVTNTKNIAASFSIVDEQGAVGVVAQHTDGTIQNHVFTQSQPTNYVLRTGSTSRGVSAVVDHADALKPVYVFSAEADGLWYLRVTSQGAAWDSWCHVETRNNIYSPPSAVYIDNGNIRIYAQSATNHLLQWRITPTANSCVHAAADDRADILVTSAPVAVSWPTSNDYGRIDVFATFSDHVIHAWKASTTDDRVYDSLQLETAFWIGSVHQQVMVEPGTAMYATAPAITTLDAAYRAPDGSIRHLFYRGNGFSTEAAMDDEVDHFAIDTTRDHNFSLTPPIYIIQGCVDASMTIPAQCGSFSRDSTGYLNAPTNPIFLASHVLAMRGYTDSSKMRWLFVVDADSHQLVYTKGDLTSGY